MDYIIDLITNPLFLSAAAGWLICQATKVLIPLFRDHTFDIRILLSSGGMPSAHSATVMGLVTATFLKYGTGGFEFPMALFFAFVVVFDSMNVRRETGEQGKVLNRLRREHPELFRGKRAYRFNEKAGHTPPEVAVGILVGIAGGVIVHLIIH